jgi:hypothetical protein
MIKKMLEYVVIISVATAILLWIFSYINFGINAVESGVRWLLFSGLFLMAEIIGGFFVLSKHRNSEFGWALVIAPLLLLLIGISICSNNILRN